MLLILILQNILGRKADFIVPAEKPYDKTHSSSSVPLSSLTLHGPLYSTELLLVANIVTSVEITIVFLQMFIGVGNFTVSPSSNSRASY